MLVELISAMDEPSPPPATNAQGSTANKAEMKRPSSPVALCLEGPLHEPHTQGPASDTSQQTLHTLPGLDFLQSDDPLLQFSLPFQGAGNASHGTGQNGKRYCLALFSKQVRLANSCGRLHSLFWYLSDRYIDMR